MYFPDTDFIPVLRSIDEVVKGVIKSDTLQDDDKVMCNINNQKNFSL